MDQVKRWQYWVELLLGLILMESPWLLGAGSVGVVTWSSLVGGAAIAIVAAYSICPPEGRPVEWLNVPIGLALAATPYVLGFSGMTDVTRLDIAVGVAVAVLSTWGGRTMPARDQAADQARA